MNNPLVSIIIPVYNSAAFLATTINSAISQTWSNKEIIIVDDGSKDNSLSIAKNFQNSWIKVFSQENKGASATRNFGLLQASGQYIQFLDADDLLSENKIAVQLELLTTNPNHVGLCHTVHFSNGTNPFEVPIIHEWYATGSENNVDFLIKLYGGSLIGPTYGGAIQPNAWLTPKHVIEKAGQWNEMRNPDDDGEFFCRVLLASDGIVYAPNAVNYYRKFISSTSLSAQRTYESCKNILESTKLKAENLLKATDDPKAKLAMSAQLWGDAFMFYPSYKDLSAKAETVAKELYPSLRINPFINPIKKVLAQLFGWKFVKLLDDYRFKYLHDKKNS